MNNQEKDIRLYMFLRLVLLFSVLVSLVVFQRTGILSRDTIVKTYFVTFFTFFVTTGFIFLYEKAKNVSYFLTSQVAYDILFTTVLIFYTGPYESMYTIFYLFNIMFAALLFPRVGAVIAAIASSLLYCSIAWINSDRTTDDKAFSILITITGFVSLSLLAGQLVEELRKSRQHISRLEELSEEIVNSLDTGLLALDSHDVVRKVNRTAREILAVVDETFILGRTVREVLPMLGDVSGRLSEIKEVNVRERMRRMLITRVALPEKHSMILLRDLTDVLDLEEKVRRQERLAGVGRLATGVAHEIRNPIASISGAAQILSGDNSDQEERGRLTALIVRESERVDRLVNQLLRFAKPPVEQRNSVRLDEVLHECVEAIRTRPDFQELDIELELAVKGSLPVLGNRDELSEVINNLLVNSMQAFVEYKSAQRHWIKVGARKAKGQIEVVVEDNGPGIPKEFRSRVFDPFFTTKPTGTGLGLAQVHKIVRDHNGEVDLSTEEGRGTSLTIRLPA